MNKSSYKNIFRRGTILVMSLFFSCSVFAFDYIGKSFRASTVYDGIKVTHTLTFQAGNKVKMVMDGGGQKGVTGGYWQESGDYVNFWDDEGISLTMLLEYDSKGVPQLVFHDPYNGATVYYKYVAPTSSGSKSTGAKKKRK